MAFFKKKSKEAEEEKDIPEKEETKKPVKKVPSDSDKGSDDKSETSKKVTYVVSTHPDGGWQVKRAGSTKAIKRFDTKAEADAYAKKVAANNGASVLRKKKDGKIQKKL